METSIKISYKLKKKLDEKKLYDEESYEDIIWDLFESEMEIKENVQKEIQNSRNQVKNGQTVAFDVIKKEFLYKKHQQKMKTLIIGIGGSGNNIASRITEIGIDGADVLVINTDVKHLSITKVGKRILIGKELTRGLGAGGFPNIGKKAAEESEKELREALKGIDMVYVVSGLGGGTGTGSAPVVAKLAKDMGAIVIGCVTMPFRTEGARIGRAEDGLYKLRQVCDTVIVIENDRLLQIAGDLPLKQAFAVADNLISTMLKNLIESNIGYENLKSVMGLDGEATFCLINAKTNEDTKKIVQKILKSLLLDIEYHKALGCILNITGGKNIPVTRINEIVESFSANVDNKASIIWNYNQGLIHNNDIEITVIITGVNNSRLEVKEKEKCFKCMKSASPKMQKNSSKN